MIDWTTATDVLAALHRRSDSLTPVIEKAVGRSRPFRNIGYPLSPLPLYAAGTRVAARVPAIERYVVLLNRIVARYRDTPELRRWYGLGPAAEALIDADRQAPDEVAICRLDGYLAQGTERLTLLENNADAPAGPLFSVRLNRILDDLLYSANVIRPPQTELTLSGETAVLDVLLDHLRRRGLATGSPRVAVLQPAGRSNVESMEMVTAFREHGVDAVLADPRELRLVGRQVWFGVHRVDACWNKVNTVGWRGLVESDAELLGRWCAALRDADFVHLNPFGVRYVAESKLTLALPREPRFADLFTAQERALVDELLPWARRLGERAVADDGETPLAVDLLDNPNRYVLKEPYDIRGDGVTVGHAVGRRDWERAVRRALDQRLVAQRYVPPTGYPVLRPDQEPSVVTMPVSFDTFVFDGRVRGFGAKASLNARVNVFQGGQKLAVHVTP